MLILNGLVPNPIHCVAKQMVFWQKEWSGGEGEGEVASFGSSTGLWELKVFVKLQVDHRKDK